MAQKKQKDDIVNVVLSINASTAERKIHELTAANKDLTKANQERLKKMRELEMLGRTEQQSYKNLKAAYQDTSKAIRENNGEIEKYRRNLNLTTMSYNELKREASKLRTQLNNTSKSLNPTEWNALNERLKAVSRSMKNVEVGAYSVGKSLCASIKEAVAYQVGLQSLVTWVLRLLGNVRDFLGEGIRIAGVAQGIDEAFGRIADKDYLSGLREQTKGLLNDNFLKKFTVQANNLGIPIEHMGKLLAFAQQRAKDTGESVDYLSESIVKGLGRKSVLILDNIGLSAVRINEEFKRTGDFSAAVTKIVEEEMAKVGHSMDTAAEADVRRAVRWQNLQERIGRYLVKFSEMRSKIESGFVDSLDRSLSWMEKHWSKITLLFYSLTSAIVAYKVAVNKAIILEKLHIFWITAKRIALTAGAYAYNLLSGNIMRANAALRLLNITLKGNLWGWVAAAIAGVAVSLYTLYTRSQDLTEAKKALMRVSKKSTEEFNAQAAKVDALSKTIENNKLSLEARRAAIEKLKEIMPEYNGYISNEGVLYNHNTAAIQRYLTQLEKQIKMKAAQEELEDAYRKKRQLDNQEEKQKAVLKSAEDRYKLSRDNASLQSNKLSGSGMKNMAVGMSTSASASGVAAAKNELEKTQSEQAKNLAVISELNNEINKTSISLSASTKKTEDAVVSLIAIQQEELEQAKKLPETTEAEIAAKNKKIASIEKEIERLNSLGRAGKSSADTTAKAEKDRIDAVKSAIGEEIRLFEESQTRIRLDAKKRQEAGKMTAEEYASVVAATEKASADFRLEQYRELYRSLENLEVKNGKDKKRAIDEASTAILKAEEDVIDKRIALNASLATIAEKAWQEVQKKQKAAREKADLDKEAGKAPDQMRQQFGLGGQELENKMKLVALDEYYKQALEKYKDNEQTKQELAAVYAQAKAKIEIDAEAEKLRALADMGFAGQLAAFAQEMISLRDQHRQGLLEEQEYQKKKADLKKRFTEFSVKAVTEIAASAVGYMQEQEMLAVDQKYASEIAAAQGNQEKLREIEERKEAEKLAIQKKYADINFVIKAAEIVANTAIAVTRALAELGPIAGPIAAAAMSAAGAVQLAIANQERQKVKNAQPGGSGGSASTSTSGMPVRVASGREAGGYIDVEREQDGKRFRAMHEPRKRGYVDRPTVIVGEGPRGRSREWVASNDALANPTVAPLIRMLDAAQLSGQIRTIDMGAVLRSRLVGHESGGYIDRSSSAPASASGLYPLPSGVSSDPRMVRALERFVDTLDRTGKEGIRASVVYSDMERKRKIKERSEDVARKR